jgi:hypothetical protein
MNFSMPPSAYINDADGDEVADELDRYPGTQYWSDAEVDEFGCQGEIHSAQPTTEQIFINLPQVLQIRKNGCAFYICVITHVTFFKSYSVEK